MTKRRLRRGNVNRHRPAVSSERWRRGDEQSRFMAELQEHHNKMRGLALRVLHDSSAADDALQNAYIKAYQKRDTLRDNTSVSSWLYTIVYRSCIDEHRRRRPTVPFDETQGNLIADPSVAFDQTISQRHGLREALGQLNPAQRAAVWLVDAEGMTFVEAAKVLDVPSGTVASRVSRARETLRVLLSDSADSQSKQSRTNTGTEPKEDRS